MTYGVWLGGVEVGADNAVLLDFGEELFGERVGVGGGHGGVDLPESVFLGGQVCLMWCSARSWLMLRWRC